MTNVIQGDERPKMDHQHTALWPMNLQWLIKSCWSANAATRPSFDVVVKTLVEIQTELSTTIKTSERRRTKSTGSQDEDRRLVPPPPTLSPSSKFQTGLPPVFESMKKPPTPRQQQQQRVALVTGSTDGIGLTTAKNLANQEGMIVLSGPLHIFLVSHQ